MRGKKNMNEVKIIKLSTSEEIICTVVGMTDSVVKVKSPMGIGPTPMRDGLTLFPWSVCALRPKDDEVFEIRLDSVVMIHDAPEEVATSYSNSTSRLYTPTVEEKSLILG